MTKDQRDYCVARLRELADKLESGDAEIEITIAPRSDIVIVPPSWYDPPERISRVVREVRHDGSDWWIRGWVMP